MTTDELRVVGIYATVRELAKTSSEGIPADGRLTPPSSTGTGPPPSSEI